MELENHTNTNEIFHGVSNDSFVYLIILMMIITFNTYIVMILQVCLLNFFYNLSYL
jgi:general stress protein CsbA